MDSAKKGQWVQIHNIVLKPEERTAQIPEDTKKTPVQMWVKGNLNHDANIGDLCEITTVTGRVVKGRLHAVEPSYEHGFGGYVNELNIIRDSLRAALGV